MTDDVPETSVVTAALKLIDLPSFLLANFRIYNERISGCLTFKRTQNKIRCSSVLDGGADPKSPVGTAASFSKANKYALKIANSSLFFEFATNELLNSINGG